MARVKTHQKCFVGNTIREEGEVFEYDGPRVTYFEYLEGDAVEISEPSDEPQRRKPGRPRKAGVNSDSTA
ncbi:MAG: hypothetical protein EBU14_13900 [Acetobacteraceae bacterium]|nr:hypothetical protein [Acetobacteraceae bacterium]